MAEDMELNLGIKADTKGLEGALGDAASLFGDEMRAQYQSVINDILGSGFLDQKATKTWRELPFARAHVFGGKGWVTGALMQGTYNDLSAMGVESSSDEMQNALMIAGVSQALPDPEERSAMFHALGLEDISEEALPTSEINKILTDNLELLKQSWSKQFVTEEITKVPVMGVNKAGKEYQKRRRDPTTGKLAPLYTEQVEVSPDFGAMREYAVEQGLGEWISPEESHNAANFRLLDNSLEDIGERTEDINENFLAWADNLKSTLGTLTAMGSVLAIPEAINKATQTAAAGVKEAATALHNTRYFMGMTSIEEMQTKKASSVLGIGEDSIYNDIVALSNMRTSFTELGKGLEPIYSSLLGTFNDIVDRSNSPYEAYQMISQELLDRVKGGDLTQQQLERFYMLMSGQGLKAMPEIVGALANEQNLANMYPDVFSLFALRDNPYYGVYDRVERVNAQAEEIQTSINASNTQLYTRWQEEFGVPFMAFWDKLLQTVIVPGMEFLTTVKDLLPEKKSINVDEDAINKALERQRESRISKTVDAASDLYRSGFARLSRLPGVPRFRSGNVDEDTKQLLTTMSNPETFADVGTVLKDYSGFVGYKDFRSFANALQDYGEQFEAMGNVPGTNAFNVLSDWMEHTGAYDILRDKKATQLDKDIVSLIQEFLNRALSGDSNALQNASTFLESNTPSNITPNADDMAKFTSAVEKFSQYIDEGMKAEIEVRVKDEYGNEMSRTVINQINKL